VTLVTYCLSVDEVFRSLADPTDEPARRACSAEDGQTLSALEERFSMTRFGVMST